MPRVSGSLSEGRVNRLQGQRVDPNHFHDKPVEPDEPVQRLFIGGDSTKADGLRPLEHKPPRDRHSRHANARGSFKTHISGKGDACPILIEFVCQQSIFTKIVCLSSDVRRICCICN